MCKKKLYAACAAIVMAVAVMMFFPLMGAAGSLEPSAPPGPTMKTLDEINISWHQKLSQGRFVSVLDNYEAVLDKETNLVWQKVRTTTQYTWVDAINACFAATYGGRYGWRLPTVEELFTVFDPNAGGYPWLPEGHIFSGQVAGAYWTSTTDPSNPANAFYISNGSQTNPPARYSYAKTGDLVIWCVRGGHGYDGQ